MGPSDAAEWLLNERLDCFKINHSSILPLLRQSGLLRPLLLYWIKSEVSTLVDPPESLNLPSLRSQWIKNNKGQIISLTDQEIDSKLLVPIRLETWCRSVWESSIQGYFLKHKPSLDTVSFRLIRFKDKGLAFEIYHQIVAQEIQFTTAVLEYSCGREVRSGGLLIDQSSSMLPEGFFDLLRRQPKGTLPLPIRAGDEFWIVQLRQINEAVLDKLWLRSCCQRFDEWSNSVVMQAVDRL